MPVVGTASGCAVRTRITLAPTNPPSPLTLAGLTLFATIVSPSYLLVIFSAGLQVIALAWFVASHIPGGVQGMTAMSGMVMRATTAMVMRGN